MVGSAGSERQITNVAAGTASTDAVNVSQLSATNAKVTALTASVATLSNRNPDVTSTPIDTTTGAIASGAGSTAYGRGAISSGDNSVAFGQNAVSIGTNGASLGTGALVTASGGVALGANSVADRANTVSVGSAGSERQITNVAAGTASTDAVNVQQLNTALSGIGSANDAINARINGMDTRLSRVGAMASAISGLSPLPYDPKAPFQLLLGVGDYSGQQAVALGASYYVNDSMAFNLGFSLSGGENMGRIGVAWKLGAGGKKAVETAKATDSTVATLQKEVRELTKQNQQMQEQIAQLKKLMENRPGSDGAGK